MKCGVYAHECDQADETGPCVHLKKPEKREKRARKPIARNSRPARSTKRIARKTPTKRQSAKKLASLKRSLWTRFAAYVKERDGDQCFTCDAFVTGHSKGAGHFFDSGGHALIRYEPKNVHTQCSRCNCTLRGNGPVYTIRFIEKYGRPEYDRLAELAKREKHWHEYEIRELIEALKKGAADFECLYAEKYGLTTQGFARIERGDLEKTGDQTGSPQGEQSEDLAVRTLGIGKDVQDAQDPPGPRG